MVAYHRRWRWEGGSWAVWLVGLEGKRRAFMVRMIRKGKKLLGSFIYLFTPLTYCSATDLGGRSVSSW